MDKIYSLIGSTDYTSPKYYHLVEFLQNKPHRSQDWIDAQGLILQKYHSDLEKLIGDDVFIVGSGTGLTVGTEEYIFDGRIVVDGVLFDFDNYTVVLDTQTLEVDDPIDWAVTSVAATSYFYLKVESSSKTYLDDSTIALKDPVTPSYIETSTRKSLSPKIIWSATAKTDTATVAYRTITGVINSTLYTTPAAVIPLSIGSTVTHSDLFLNYIGKLDNLFAVDDETINGKQVVLISETDFDEYPQVTGLDILNVSGTGTFASPELAPSGNDSIKLVWDDMTQKGTINNHPLADGTTATVGIDKWRSVQSYIGYMLIANIAPPVAISNNPLQSTFPNGAGPYTVSDPYIPVVTNKFFPLTGSLYWDDGTGDGLTYSVPSTLLSEDYVGGNNPIVLADEADWPTTADGGGFGYFADGSEFQYSTLVSGDGTTATLTIVNSAACPAKALGTAVYCMSRVVVETIIATPWATHNNNAIALSRDPMGIWYKAFETKDTSIEFEAPKGKVLTFWVGAKIREIETSVLSTIPTLLYDQY